MMGTGITGGNFGIDGNHEDPQLCATLTCDIYKHLRQAEVNYNVDISVFFFSFFFPKW